MEFYKGTSMTEPQAVEVSKEDFIGGASLKVVNPIVLANIIGPAGHIPSALANFGHIKYGNSITARVYLSSDNAEGCQDFKSDK
jgi:hypothetical protein